MTLTLATSTPAHIETDAGNAAPQTGQALNTSSEPIQSNQGVSEQVGWAIVGKVQIEVRYENGQYVAIDDATGMYGEGDVGIEAIADLLGSLVEHRRDLAAHRSTGLSRHLQQQLVDLERSLPR